MNEKPRDYPSKILNKNMNMYVGPYYIYLQVASVTTGTTKSTSLSLEILPADNS